MAMVINVLYYAELHYTVYILYIHSPIHTKLCFFFLLFPTKISQASLFSHLCFFTILLNPWKLQAC